jgi:malate dehydrogenase (oxaloacetate-decarboxylating)
MLLEMDSRPTEQDLLAKAEKPARDALRLHPFYRGKIQVASRCPIQDVVKDFSVWYTPGVAAPCRAIQENEDLAYEYTSRGNTVAVISDSTRVQGLQVGYAEQDIKAVAGLPLMEGKALLFKHLGGVDAIPICLDAKDPHDIVTATKWLQPSFGGVNLEDISQPKCFQVLDMLRSDPEVSIPVWHDDQQGTATIILAGLINALKIVGKRMEDLRVALVGVGAVNVATLPLLLACDVQFGNVVACDSKGILHPEREDIERRKDEFAGKWWICQHSNAESRRGGAHGRHPVAETMRGADLCIAASRPGPGAIRPEWVEAMAEDAILFTLANPIPEIWPWEAKEAGARIVGTSRGDFPNQINNSLVFPGIFRGVLDVRAKTISDEMAIAAAEELAAFQAQRGLDEEHIVPTVNDWEVFPREAAAVGVKAQEQGLARLALSRDELLSRARQKIRQAQDMTLFLMDKGLISPLPEAQWGGEG